MRTIRNVRTTGVRCYVGFGSHLEGKAVAPIRPEGLKIHFDGQSLFLLGEIVATGVNSSSAPMDRGVMHAVETFSEQVLGYRFLFSTPDDEVLFELGNVVPSLRKLALVPGLLIEDAPVFSHRTSSLSPRNQMGHRSGSAPAFFCNHSYGMPWWSEQFGPSHPEMFIRQKPDRNIQDDQAAKVMATQADLSFLDFTEPRVLESRLEQYTRFYQDGEAGGFYFNPTLHYLVEEPPDWMAETVQYNERSSALFDPNHHPWGNFSNIWFDYLNRLAQQMRLRWPGRRVATLAYMRHYGVPTLPVDDDIDVMVTMMRTSMGNKEPDVFEKNLADVKKWSACLQGNRNRLFLWEYECWPAMWTSVPILCPNAMKHWLRNVRPYVSGVFLESHGPNEYYFIMNRLWMRLLWNPDLDVAAELDDICRRFFGPAGETMRKFHSQLIERYETPWKDPRLTWDQYYLDDDLYFRQSYPPEEVEVLALLLEQARREVGLPPVVTKEVANGSAIFLTNISKDPCSVSIIIRANKDPVVNPSVVWDGGSLSWSGSLGPDEWLEVSDLVATVFSADGERRSVVVRTGSTPQLKPQGSMCFGFQQALNRPEAHFEVTLRYGPDDTKSPSPLNANLFAKRLDWLSDAYQVLPPFHVWRDDPQHPREKVATRGFFADAYRRQMKMGLRPTWPTVNATDAICTPDNHRAADALVESSRTALANADKMTEEARIREISIARKAFVNALARCPDWKIDEVPQDDVWGMIAARKERAEIWERLGNSRRMRTEYEEALSIIPKQQADAISYLYMLMGDAFAQLGNWAEAESCYLQAQKVGLYGDRKNQIPHKLEKVRQLTHAQHQAVTTP